MKKSKIQELYDNEKSRGFVNHLIRSYLPVYKVEKVWEFKKGQKHRCNVCGQSLLSIEEAMKNMRENQDAYMADFMQNLKDEINQKEVKREDRAIVKHISKGSVLGFTGEKTDTCLCHTCVTQLLELTQNGIFSGDKNISYQMNQMRRDEVFKQFESDTIDEGRKEEVKQLKKKVNKQKGATFGDLEALQKLKEEMDNGKKI